MISTYPLTGEVTKKAFAVTGKKYQNFALYPSFHHPLFFKGKSLCNSIGLYLDHLTETSGKKVNAQCKTHKNITERRKPWGLWEHFAGETTGTPKTRGRSNKLRGLRRSFRRILTPLAQSLELWLEAQQEQAPSPYRDLH